MSRPGVARIRIARLHETETCSGFSGIMCVCVCVSLISPRRPYRVAAYQVTQGAFWKRCNRRRHSCLQDSHAYLAHVSQCKILIPYVESNIPQNTLRVPDPRTSPTQQSESLPVKPNSVVTPHKDTYQVITRSPCAALHSSCHHTPTCTPSSSLLAID
jgi:hypothetical protein